MTSTYNDSYARLPTSASVFTNHFQDSSSSFSPRFCKFECNTTSDWLNRKPYGLANQKSCYIQMLLNVKQKIWRSRIRTFLTLSETIPSFYGSRREDLKILWEKEKMLVTSIFSFSHDVFYTIKQRNFHFFIQSNRCL